MTDDPRLQPPHAQSSRRWLWGSFLGLLAVLLLAYLRVLFLDETFAVRDHLTWTLPSRAFLAESLRHGHWPEWWNNLRLGERFAADPNHGVTYPLAWLVALGDPLLGADLVLLLHLLLAGTGLLLFARRLGASPLGAWFGATALMTSGYMTSMVVNGSILMPLGWMPLVAWAALGVARVETRRDQVGRGLVLAGVLAGSVASGNPAHVNNMVLAGAIVMLVARRRVAALATLLVSGALALLMGAASLLPPLLTLPDSARAGGLTLEQSGAWSMHPLRLVELLWPQFLGQGLRPESSLASLWARGGGTLEAIWSGSNYIGLPVLFCAGVAAFTRRGAGRRLGLLSLFFLVLALGTFTPVYRVYRSIFMFEHVLRYPEKHLASALVLWCALAAVGLDALFAVSRARAARIAVAVAALFAAAWAVGGCLRPDLRDLIVRASQRQGVGIDADAALAAVLDGGLSAVALSLAIVVAIWLFPRPRIGRFMRPGLVVIAVAQLIAHDWSVHVLVPRDLIRNPPAILAPLEKPEPAVPPRLLRRAEDTTPITVSGEIRAAYLHQLAIENTATRFGFDQLPGYSIAGTARFDAFALASGKASLERIMDLLDIRYLILRAADAPAMGMPPASPDAFAGHVVLENLDRRSRAFVSYRWRHLASDSQILDQLFVPNRADLDLGAIRLVGVGQGGDETRASDKPSPCQILRQIPERVRLLCHAMGPGYAVLLDEWTHGWTATLDGRPVDIERADSVFRAVAIPAGDHAVDMRYRTPGLRVGAALSLAGWLCFALLVALHLRGRARSAA